MTIYYSQDDLKFHSATKPMASVNEEQCLAVNNTQADNEMVGATSDGQ